MKNNKKNNKKNRKIDFKYNLSQYWKFLRKYKPVFFAAILMIIIVEISLIADRFLIKEVIDRGNNYLDGTITQEVFIGILISIALIAIGIVLLRYGLLRRIFKL